MATFTAKLGVAADYIQPGSGLTVTASSPPVAPTLATGGVIVTTQRVVVR